ncbi:unnamed protein product [Orchesella dallaii]|uniref:Uncharacterized protein n=1 Tax=Orchesella dallaii TaxID=48710 RepID=A0ABP1PVD8_9HEXA
MLYRSLIPQLMDVVNPDTDESDEEINSDTWSNSEPEESIGEEENNEGAPGQNEEPSSLDEDEENENDFKDEDYDDDSFQNHSLLDDLELKFRMILATKIDEVQQLFDTAELALMRSPQEEEQEKEPIPHCSKAIQDPVPGPSKETALEISDDENYSIAQVRHKIYMLRNCRESLISQRERWNLQLEKKNKIPKNERKKAQQKLYELEESVGIIDTAIEFKNEIISQGKTQQRPPPQIENEVAPELERTFDLLTPEELKRLLSKSLLKIVELRSSSRSLEKEVEHMETSNDKLKHRLKREHKLLKETKLDYQARIQLLFSGGNENTKMDLLLKQMDDKLEAARKKQHDLQRSLQELLVRDGYLVDGADFDVKQVVRTLGIEGNGVPPEVDVEVEVENVPPENRQHYHHRRQNPGGAEGGGGEVSRTRQRRKSAAFRPRLHVHWQQRRFSGVEFHHRNRRGNGRDLYSALNERELLRERSNGRKRFDVENWKEEREPRRVRRNVQPPPPPPEFDVFRKKRKLVIQEHNDHQDDS